MRTLVLAPRRIMLAESNWISAREPSPVDNAVGGFERRVDGGGDGLAGVAARYSDRAVDQAEAGDAMLGGIGGVVLALGRLALRRRILPLRIRLRPRRKPSRQAERQKSDWRNEPSHGIYYAIRLLYGKLGAKRKIIDVQGVSESSARCGLVENHHMIGMGR